MGGEGKGRGGRALSPFLGSPCLPPSLLLCSAPRSHPAPGLALLWLCACSSACSPAGHWQDFANPTKRRGREHGAPFCWGECVCVPVGLGLWGCIKGWCLAMQGLRLRDTQFCSLKCTSVAPIGSCGWTLVVNPRKTKETPLLPCGTSRSSNKGPTQEMDPCWLPFSKHCPKWHRVSCLSKKLD